MLQHASEHLGRAHRAQPPRSCLAALFGASEAQAQQCEEPLCSGGDSFNGSGTDASGVTYGVCAGCNWLGHCSHQVVYCPAGRTLNTSTGECVLDACTGSGGCGAVVDLCEADEVYSNGGTDATGPRSRASRRSRRAPS